MFMSSEVKHHTFEVNKNESHFFYFTLESNEGLSFYSTRPHSEGDTKRIIDVYVPESLKTEFTTVIQHLGKKIELKTL